VNVPSDQVETFLTNTEWSALRLFYSADIDIQENWNPQDSRSRDAIRIRPSGSGFGCLRIRKWTWAGSGWQGCWIRASKKIASKSRTAAVRSRIVSALQKAGITNMKPQLVYVKTFAAAQFVQSGSAPAGNCGLIAAISPAMR